MRGHMGFSPVLYKPLSHKPIFQISIQSRCASAIVLVDSIEMIAAINLSPKIKKQHTNTPYVHAAHVRL